MRLVPSPFQRGRPDRFARDVVFRKHVRVPAGDDSRVSQSIMTRPCA